MLQHTAFLLSLTGQTASDTRANVTIVGKMGPIWMSDCTQLEIIIAAFTKRKNLSGIHFQIRFQKSDSIDYGNDKGAW